MSINQEITRINTDKVTIRNKLVSAGLVESNANLDTIAEAIDGMTVNNTISAEIVEGESFTITQGYHKGGTVTAIAGGGDYDLQSKTVTPTKSQQTVTSDEGFYGLSSVTVNAIPQNYADVSQTTASAGDVLVNKSFVNANGVATAGTMADNGTVNRTLDTSTTSYTIAAGKHSGSGKIQISLEEKSATPTETAQNITPTSGKVLSKVVVGAIPDKYIDTSSATVIASKLLDDEVAYGYDSTTHKAVEVVGTMANNGALSGTLNTTTKTFTIPAGYTTGGSVSITTEEKTATPSTSSQTITPTAGKVLSKVTVNAIPSSYANTSDATIDASEVLSGQIAYGYNSGTGSAIKITGSMANNGDVSGTITGMGTITGDTYVDIPAGYTTGGRVSLTSDIENALALV